jgi:uncharacterized protein YjdB
MKKSILFVVVSVGIYFSLVSYSNGGGALSDSDGTGAKGGGGCSCHQPVPTTEIGVSIELDSAGIPVEQYYPGMTYTIKISGTNNSKTKLPKFGFRMSVVKSKNSGTLSAKNAGEIGAYGLPEYCQQMSIGNFSIVEHTAPIKATSGIGGPGSVYEKSIPWVAPAGGTGEVKIYGVMLGANGNKKENGDKWNKGVKSIKEADMADNNAITGNTSVCVKQSTTLQCAKTGGSWASSNPEVAYIDASSGLITGVSVGRATITYSNAGRDVYAVATVNSTPVLDRIEGREKVCAGSAIKLKENIKGGIWSSDNEAIATISGLGDVMGIAEGTATITYNITDACGSAAKTKTIYVQRTPNAGSITGTKSDFCVGTSLKLKATMPNGVWTTSCDVAGVSGDGTVIGLSEGKVLIYYTLKVNDCASVAEKELNFYTRPDTAIISGPWGVKVNTNAQFYASVPGGIWDIAKITNNAAITKNGIFYGMKEGTTVVIEYTVNNGTCWSVRNREVSILSKDVNYR